MGKGPSEIIPVPKQMDIRPGRCAWPRRVAVRCESAQALSLVPAFESELRGGEKVGWREVDGSEFDRRFLERSVPVRRQDAGVPIERP